MEKIIFASTATFILYNIVKWRKRKFKFIIFSSLLFAAINIGTLILCNQWWGISDNFWWKFAVPFILFEVCQILSFTIMLMDGGGILNQYKLPIWHKTYDEYTTLGVIRQREKSSYLKVIFNGEARGKELLFLQASEQIYQLLRINPEHHHRLYMEQSMTFSMLFEEDITIKKLQQMVKEDLISKGCCLVRKDEEIIKHLADVFISMSILRSAVWTPEMTEDGLLDIRSPYEKEIEWRKQNKQ